MAAGEVVELPAEAVEACPAEGPAAAPDHFLGIDAYAVVPPQRDPMDIVGTAVESGSQAVMPTTAAAGGATVDAAAMDVVVVAWNWTDMTEEIVFEQG